MLHAKWKDEQTAWGLNINSEGLASFFGCQATQLGLGAIFFVVLLADDFLTEYGLHGISQQGKVGTVHLNGLCFSYEPADGLMSVYNYDFKKRLGI